MNTRKVKEIVKFDVERYVQNSFFAVLNICMLIFIVIITNISNIINFLENHDIKLFSEKTYGIKVLDEEDLFYDDFEKKCEEYDNLRIAKVSENNYSKSNVPASNVILVEVHRDDEDVISAKIVSEGEIDESVYDLICESLKEARSKVFAQNHEMTVEELNVLNEDVKVEKELLRCK
jgi:hypothetical protein